MFPSVAPNYSTIADSIKWLYLRSVLDKLPECVKL